MSSSSSVKVVLGAMDFGRFATEENSLVMVNKFLDAGFNEVDTARVYVDGESENIIGRFPSEVKSRIILHTKANPLISAGGGKGLSRQNIVNQCQESLAALKLKPSTSSPPIDIYYLHQADSKTSILDTLKAMNELHSQGNFKRLGLSNFTAWQVMEVYQVCKQNNFVLPTVYQGMYNSLTRAVEPELFPCLRQLSIAFYAYNPVAGGLLTGKYSFSDKPTEDGRFANNKSADMYLDRYWKKSLFEAIDHIKAELSRAYGGQVTLTEASLRWMSHHSQLKGERGDAVILGASKIAHVEQNLKGMVAGPLDDAVVKAFDTAWQQCRGDVPPYHRTA